MERPGPRSNLRVHLRRANTITISVSSSLSGGIRGALQCIWWLLAGFTPSWLFLAAGERNSIAIHRLQGKGQFSELGGGFGLVGFSFGSTQDDGIEGPWLV